jgi:hypothetical protein
MGTARSGTSLWRVLRDKWYGDNRDLVKWGVLLELAHRYQASHILQVLYQRPSTWERLEIDGEQVQLPAAVVQHFRNATSVSAMQCSARVDVVSETFGDRSDYLQIVIQRIRLRAQLPGIVFLDPDTGLEPRFARPEHVLDSELSEIWEALRSDDIMVFYQHQTNRGGTSWIEPKKAQFERALGVREGSSKVARAPGIAPDVAFFYIQKNGKETSISS